MEAGSSWPQLLAAHPMQVPHPPSQELLAPGFALLTAPTVSPPSVEWVPLAHRSPSYLPSEGSSITSSLPTAAPTSLLPLACPPHQQGPHQWGQPPVCCRIQAASLSSSPWAEGIHAGGHALLPTLSSPGFPASPPPLFLLPQGCSPADPLPVKHLVDLSGAGHCSGAGGTACLKHARSLTPWGLRS